jgi:hypothetical protein
MIAKGEAFLGAALLTRRHGGAEPHEFVFLHLLCQGVELVAKGSLLLSDYDRHSRHLSAVLKRQHKSPDPAIGHDIVLGSELALKAYGLKPMRQTLRGELRSLSDFYENHLLRYGSVTDIYIAPSSIRYEKVLRRLVASVRLTRKHLAS